MVAYDYHQFLASGCFDYSCAKSTGVDIHDLDFPPRKHDIFTANGDTGVMGDWQITIVSCVNHKVREWLLLNIREDKGLERGLC